MQSRKQLTTVEKSPGKKKFLTQSLPLTRIASTLKKLSMDLYGINELQFKKTVFIFFFF